MIQSAMKEPTCQKDHPAEYKNNGRPTTNQISLEPNRNNLARDKVFILLDLLRNVFNVFDGFNNPKLLSYKINENRQRDSNNIKVYRE